MARQGGGRGRERGLEYDGCPDTGKKKKKLVKILIQNLAKSDTGQKFRLWSKTVY